MSCCVTLHVMSRNNKFKNIFRVPSFLPDSNWKHRNAAYLACNGVTFVQMIHLTCILLNTLASWQEGQSPAPRLSENFRLVGKYSLKIQNWRLKIQFGGIYGKIEVLSTQNLLCLKLATSCCCRRPSLFQPRRRWCKHSLTANKLRSDSSEWLRIERTQLILEDWTFCSLLPSLQCNWAVKFHFTSVRSVALQTKSHRSGTCYSAA